MKILNCRPAVHHDGGRFRDVAVFDAEVADGLRLNGLKLAVTPDGKKFVFAPANALERQVELLRQAMTEATTSLTPFRPHYDVIHEMSQALTKAINLLNERPEDYEKPHRSLFS